MRFASWHGLKIRHLLILAGAWLSAACCLAQTAAHDSKSTSIFAPDSTPADAIFGVSMFILAVTGVIFAIVFSLLVYAAVKFRNRPTDDRREPLQIYGSNQLELAWTVIPILIVIVLFMTSARVIHEVQDARQPEGTIQVIVTGHQFWWEYTYPQYGFVTANELHIPLSNPAHPTPTFLQLLSADTDHSFWIPRLAGKTDLIPNHPVTTWIEPHEIGLYLGQCAQYCGTQHAKMLLRAYVESRADFDRWVQTQQKMAGDGSGLSPEALEGRKVFNATACVNCHVIAGTVATGHFGPDLTHLMSRETIASGAAPNTAADLRRWIRNPADIKPGSLMPSMNLTDQELDQVTAYLVTLH
jgi:cytochrome c oxidase subunit II